MKLTFLGTRGCVDAATRRRKMQTIRGITGRRVENFSVTCADGKVTNTRST